MFEHVMSVMQQAACMAAPVLFLGMALVYAFGKAATPPVADPTPRGSSDHDPHAEHENTDDARGQE